MSRASDTQQSRTGPILFAHPVARRQLVEHGHVVTTRSRERTTGSTWWRETRTGPKQGDVYVTKVGSTAQWRGIKSVKISLREHVAASGFDSVDHWLDGIRETHDGVPERLHLYHVVARNGDDELRTDGGQSREVTTGPCPACDGLVVNGSCDRCSRSPRTDGGTDVGDSDDDTDVDDLPPLIEDVIDCQDGGTPPEVAVDFVRQLASQTPGAIEAAETWGRPYDRVVTRVVAGEIVGWQIVDRPQSDHEERDNYARVRQWVCRRPDPLEEVETPHSLGDYYSPDEAAAMIEAAFNGGESDE